MKELAAIVIGIICIPIICILLFVGIQHLLEYVTDNPIGALNHTAIIIPEVIITIILIVCWFISNPLKAKWDD